MFKKIILLTLFSLSILLLTINILTPFGRGDNPSSFETKQQTLHTNPTETQKEAVWTFLQSQEDFGRYNLKTEDWNSWLDLIKQRKPQKTLRDGQVSAVVDLRPLWDVNSTTSYSNLTPDVKKVLTNLFSLSYRGQSFNYKNIIQGTLINFSFDKEAKGSVYKLIETLKTNDRWINLIKYQIKKIADVNIESLLRVSEITSLSANKSGYDGLSNDVQITLRNLIDLDIDSSPYFNFLFRNILSNIGGYRDILAALGTRIDNVIVQVRRDASNLWNFLKQKDRLKNIQKYKIYPMPRVGFSSFYNTDFSKTYEELKIGATGTLYDLLQVNGYKTKIDEHIKVFFESYNRIKYAWTFLTAENRLKNIKQYQIKVIEDITLLPAFQNVAASTAYENLTETQKTIIYDLRQLANYQTAINDAIQNTQKTTAANTAWTFLTAENRLKNIKQYQIKVIEDITLLPAFQNVAASTTYENLTETQKTIIYDLSQLANYQKAINDAIQNTIKKTTAANTAWTFLQSNNRLKKLQANQTLKTKNFDLSLLNTTKPNTKYEDLTTEQKTALYNLSKLKNYQNTIKKTLVDFSKKNTEDSTDLLWLWITLPLVFAFLIFGFGFYFYRFKKKSKIKEKN